MIKNPADMTDEQYAQCKAELARYDAMRHETERREDLSQAQRYKELHSLNDHIAYLIGCLNIWEADAQSRELAERDYTGA